MKTTILLSAVAVGSSFVPRPRHARGVLSIGASNENELDFSKLYNLDGEFNQAEALKTGIHLTRLMRQVTVDYKEEVDRIEKNIVKLKDQKAYISLAYSCLLHYTSTGSLTVNCQKENGALIDFDNLDLDLMNSCLAKYGMKCDAVQPDYQRYYREDKTWTLKLSLHEENETESDDVMMT